MLPRIDEWVVAIVTVSVWSLFLCESAVLLRSVAQVVCLALAGGAPESRVSSFGVRVVILLALMKVDLGSGW